MNILYIGVRVYEIMHIWGRLHGGRDLTTQHSARQHSYHFKIYNKKQPQRYAIYFNMPVHVHLIELDIFSRSQ